MVCKVCGGRVRYDPKTNLYYHDIGFPQLETVAYEVSEAVIPGTPEYIRGRKIEDLAVYISK